MKINITTPVYNTDVEHLKQSVASVIAQTEKNWKLILVDDGSTNQETLEFLRKLKRHSQIEVVTLGRNGGIAHARNEALNHLDDDCEYVVIFDHDDMMYLDKLEKQLRYFETHEVDFLGTQIQPTDFIPPNKRIYYNKTKHPLIVTEEVVKTSMWFVNNPTVMLKRSVYDRVGRYTTEKEIVDNGIEDYEFVTRCFLAGIKIHNLEESLLIYRRHANQASRRDPQVALQIVEGIRERVREKLNYKI